MNRSLRSLRFQLMPSKDGRDDPPAPSLRDAFESPSSARVRVDAQHSIYATGDDDDAMYLIESGQVKLSMSSVAGKDCLLAIYSDGDVFGESCFVATPRRFESASAMAPTVIRRVSRRDFLAELKTPAANEALLRHVASRLADRQTAVFDLITIDAARRLAKVLLALAEKLGAADGPYLRLGQRVSHEELSQIVGTTRPRITAFMQRFRRLGLIESTTHRSISVHRDKTREFLEGTDAE